MAINEIERIHKARPAPGLNGPRAPKSVRNAVDSRTGRARLQTLDNVARTRAGLPPRNPAPPTPPLGSRLPGAMGGEANKGSLTPTFNAGSVR